MGSNVNLRVKQCAVEKENILNVLTTDFVFIFTGGELPSEFVRKIGATMKTTEIKSKAA
jgi:thioredoxin reductase